MRHYKDLHEMLNSPEYKKYIELIKQAYSESITDIYPVPDGWERRNAKSTE